MSTDAAREDSDDDDNVDDPPLISFLKTPATTTGPTTAARPTPEVAATQGSKTMAAATAIVFTNNSNNSNNSTDSSDDDDAVMSLLTTATPVTKRKKCPEPPPSSDDEEPPPAPLPPAPKKRKPNRKPAAKKKKAVAPPTAATMRQQTTPVAPTMRQPTTPPTTAHTTMRQTTPPAADTMSEAVPVTETRTRTNNTVRRTTTTTAPVHTTSQAVSKAAGKIKKGSRVSVQRKRLITLLYDDIQRAQLPVEDPDTAFYYGTITAGNSQKGYNVKLDILPDGNNIILLRRNRLTLVNVDDEEPRLDAKLVAAMEADLREDRDKRKSPETKSEDVFVNQDATTIKEATRFECKFDEARDPIVWKIYGDGEHINHDIKYNRMKEASKPKMSHIDFTKPINDNFFEHVWMEMKGTAAIIDDYLSDRLAGEYFITAQARGIKFHDPDAKDPDWKVKQCILALIAAASEIEIGLKNWQAGKGKGRKFRPDFGQWVQEAEMKCFISACPYIWADKKWWYTDPRDLEAWRISQHHL
jgi:hypothetical protein